MNEQLEILVEKLREIEIRTSEIRGEYTLFALFLRHDSPNKWDVVVSASWIDQDSSEGMKYLAQELQSSLIIEHLLMLSRIVIIEEDNPGLAYVQRVVNVQHGTSEVGESVLLGVEIRQGYFITTRKSKAA